MANADIRTNVTLETDPLLCGRCGESLSPLVVEEIDGQVQLRAGRVLISKLEAHCLRCGWTFHWNIREKDLEKMTMTYGTLLERLTTYKPE